MYNTYIYIAGGRLLPEAVQNNANDNNIQAHTKSYAQQAGTGPREIPFVDAHFKPIYSAKECAQSSTT